MQLMAVDPRKPVGTTDSDSSPQLKRTVIISLLPALVWAMALTAVLGACRGESDAPADMSAVTEAEADGFTFLGLGATTHYSDSLREQLRQRLGHDVAEIKRPLQLAIQPPGFVPRHLPELQRLNQRLNYAPRVRIEHNILRLTYRYAHKKGTPFKQVNLVFSRFTQHPLMFHIQSGKAGDDIVASIKAKYGPHEVVTDDARELETLYWQRESDVLAITIGTDRFGDPKYDIWIFYGANLAALAETEEARRQNQEQNLQEAGKQAF